MDRITHNLPLKMRMSLSSDGRWAIQAEDSKSGLIVFVIYITPEQLGTLLGTREIVTEDTLLNYDPRHGMQHVHTQILIPVDGVSSNSKAAVADIRKRCEKWTSRGWQPDEDCFVNYNRRIYMADVPYQQVIFRKYVPYDSDLAVRYRKWLNDRSGKQTVFETYENE